MGASDGFILPLQAQYVKEAIASGRSAKKIGWIGVPAHYPPSRAVAEVVPDAEQHFFDPIAANSLNTHKFDANSEGWGADLAEQGFDMLTLFRVTCHIVDMQGLINEIRGFLNSDHRTVLFEDFQGDKKPDNDTIVYRLGDTQYVAHNRPILWGEERLLDNFNVTLHTKFFNAHTNITSMYYTLTRKA